MMMTTSPRKNLSVSPLRTDGVDRCLIGLSMEDTSLLLLVLRVWRLDHLLLLFDERLKNHCCSLFETVAAVTLM